MLKKKESLSLSLFRLGHLERKFLLSDPSLSKEEEGEDGSLHMIFFFFAFFAKYTQYLAKFA